MAKRSRKKSRHHVWLYWVRDPAADEFLLQDRDRGYPEPKVLLHISGHVVDDMKPDDLDDYVMARVKRFYSNLIEVRMVKLSYFYAYFKDFGIWDNDPEKMKRDAFMGGLTWVKGQYVLVNATLYDMFGNLLPRGPHHGQIVRPTKGNVFQVYIPKIDGAALIHKDDIIDWDPGPPPE